MRLLRAGLITLASLAVVGTLAGTLAAQGNKDNSGNPAILQAVQFLQGTTNGLVTKINDLITTVNGINAAATPGNVLFTPSVRIVPPYAVGCTATNVSATTHAVRVQIFNSNTATQLDIAANGILAPGHVVVASSASAVALYAACTVTVLDGTKNDVRAAITVFTNGGSDEAMLAAQ